MAFDGRKVPFDSISTFTFAFESWFALFWVFSVEYPPSLKETCLFLEKYVIEHDTAVPASVKRLAKKLI